MTKIIMKNGSDLHFSIVITRSHTFCIVSVVLLKACLFQLQTFIITTVVSKFSNNPYGYHTSLNDRQSEGFWTFANSDSLVVDPSLM